MKTKPIEWIIIALVAGPPLIIAGLTLFKWVMMTIRYFS
jgi:hypothetical protein